MADEVRRLRSIGALVAAALGIAVVVSVIVGANSGEDASSPSADAFGANFEGLEERRVEAGVPTMSDTSAGGAHIHPRLEVYVRGERIPLPANIGIDPSRPPELMAGLHTHDESGEIHVENGAAPTLGQFFQIWGVLFGEDQLGPYRAEGDEAIRMWVDGEPSREFGELKLEDGQEVVVAFGTKAEQPSR